MEKAEKIIIILILILSLALIGHLVNRQHSPVSVHISEPDAAERIRVSVTGEVRKPGDYSVKKGARVCEVIYTAGGITINADIEYIDLDALVMDATTINIPSLDDNSIPSVVPVININTADKSSLMLIPGVGELLAQRIIDYRINNGKFSDISEIRNVRGIGEKTFAGLKDYIKTE